MLFLNRISLNIWGMVSERNIKYGVPFWWDLPKHFASILKAIAAIEHQQALERLADPAQRCIDLNGIYLE